MYSKEPDKIYFFLLKFFALLCLKFENCLCLILKYLVYHFRTCFSMLISRDLFEAILGTHSCKKYGLPKWLRGKESTCQCRRLGLILGLRTSPGEWNGNPLQYSSLGNPIDRRVWQGYSPSPWGCGELVMTEHACSCKHVLNIKLWLKKLLILNLDSTLNLLNFQEKF